jgi:opacity protein-like surface antigen
MMQSTFARGILLLSSSATLVLGGGDIAPVDTKVVEIPVVIEQSPFYLGLGVSAMSLLNNDTDEEFTATGVTLIGGYIYNEYLSIEARYTQNASNVKYDNGTTALVADTDDYPTDFVNMAIYLKPTYSLGDFGLYALLGYGEVSLTNIPIGDVTRGEDGFQWGVGMNYSITESIDLFADYTSLYSGDGFDYIATANSLDATLITVGMSYRF